MIKSKMPVLFISVLTATALLSGCQVPRLERMVAAPTSTPTPLPLQLNQVVDHTLLTGKLAEKTVSIEVVNTPQSITQGLSGRQSLGADGMLFLLPRKMNTSFWMKDMQFDLDLVWMEDSQIVEITPNVPKPPDQGKNTFDYRTLPTYSPKSPVNMVLEIEAGKANAWGLKVGDQLAFLK
jgi:uncharacterized membrane protein (UPF0127 family)